MAIPLRGARVLELGGYVAVPFGTQLLGQLGAEVIKVEGPTGDPSRARQIHFTTNNVGKRSVSIDLKTARGHQVWETLVRSADVVMQNLDDGATDRLRIGYDDCRALQPQLVYAQVRGFGAGPHQGAKATNPIIEAMTGLMSITSANGKPGRQGSPFYDQLAGILAALGVVAALNLADRSDGSGFVEADLYETALVSLAPRLAECSLTGELAGEVWGTAPYDTFQASDGKWIFLGTISDALWRRFCRAFDLTGPGSDSTLATSEQRFARKAEMDELAQKVVGGFASDEAMAKLRAADIPCAIVANFREVIDDPQFAAEEKSYSTTFNGNTVRLPASPIVSRMTQRPSRPRPPELGEDTRDVLCSLGFSDADIQRLSANGAILVHSGAAEQGGL